MASPAGAHLSIACAPVTNTRWDADNGIQYVEVANNCREVVNITSAITRDGSILELKGDWNEVLPGAVNNGQFRPSTYGAGNSAWSVTAVIAVGRDR
jgi:hypothetical protein